MKIAATARTLEGSGVVSGSSFGISADDAAHIMGILRDSLYTDKVLALLREYGANAWDSHRQSGIPNKPISVHIPTYNDPTLRIRDYGMGLTQDQVFGVYAQYGASTKRGDNVAVGALGIGGKSAFCYSSDFTITSYCEGTKSVYVASLDASDKGVIQCLAQSPTSETGIEISIPVKTWDIGEFERKARSLYRWFSPQPQINVPLDGIPGPGNRHGVLVEDDRSWVAVMGCIPYHVDIDQVQDFEEGLPKVSDFGGILYFDIGDVSVSASREELKYDAATKRALLDKINALVYTTVAEAVAQVKTGFSSVGPTTPWENRVRARALKELYRDFIDDKDEDPELHRLIDSDDAILTSTPDFKILNRRGDTLHTFKVPVSKDTIFYVRDRDRRFRLKGFMLTSTSYLLEGTNKKQTPAQVRAAFLTYLEKIGCSGIPVSNLSKLPYSYTTPSRSRSPRIKTGKVSIYSNGHWPDAEAGDIAKAGADDAVYVNLFRFRAVGDGVGMENQRGLALAMANFLGETVPVVYGYKTKDGEFRTRRRGRCWNEYYSDLQKRFVEAFKDSDTASSFAVVTAWESKGVYADSYRNLEAYYPGTELAEAMKKAAAAASALDSELKRLVKRLAPGLTSPVVSAIEETYPMLKISHAWSRLVQDSSNINNRAVYAEYFKECENAIRGQ